MVIFGVGKFNRKCFDKKFCIVTVPDLRGGGGGRANPPKGFSSITFDRDIR